ncbi:MAG: transcriptional regulator [Chloroflexi bacterium]|nr:transcriptional regulator [Chloroflexota bacterium]
MDLHIHTPASSDYQEPNASYLDLLRKAEAEGLDIIAFTDHNTVAGYARMQQEVADLERWEKSRHLSPEEKDRLEEYHRLLDKILVLPGFELTATFGFHILGIFDPDTPVRALEHLLLELNVPFAALDSGETEVGATSDVLTAYREMAEAGALVIAAHANSSHGVAMVGLGFGGQTRIAYTQDPNLHALEVTDLETQRRRTTAAFFNGSKPQYPRRMHCIQGSDTHSIAARGKNPGVGERATEVMLAEVSFEALKQVFLGKDFARTRPARREAEEPYDHVEEARKQGATIVQAFHEQYTRQGGRLNAILRDVVALANTNGGTIYVGVSSNRKVPPKGVDSVKEATNTLRVEIERQVMPRLDVELGALKSQGKDIVRLIVPKGDEAPYVLEGSKIFIREEAESALAMRDEIVALIAKTLAQPEAPPAPVAETATMAPEPAPAAALAPEPAPPAEEEALEAPPPRTGVEIVDSETHEGVTQHTMRDLRNGNEVRSVTRSSARRLWRYAIALKEKGTFQPDKVTWSGNLGLWHKYVRAGRPHFDLAQKAPSGKVHIYYGVSEDGIHGPWRAVVGMEG